MMPYAVTRAQGRELKGTAIFSKEDNCKNTSWQITQKGNENAIQTTSKPIPVLPSYINPSTNAMSKSSSLRKLTV